MRRYALWDTGKDRFYILHKALLKANYVKAMNPLYKDLAEGMYEYARILSILYLYTRRLERSRTSSNSDIIDTIIETIARVVEEVDNTDYSNDTSDVDDQIQRESREDPTITIDNETPPEVPTEVVDDNARNELEEIINRARETAQAKAQEAKEKAEQEKAERVQEARDKAAKEAREAQSARDNANRAKEDAQAARGEITSRGNGTVTTEFESNSPGARGTLLEGAFGLLDEVIDRLTGEDNKGRAEQAAQDRQNEAREAAAEVIARGGSAEEAQNAYTERAGGVDPTGRSDGAADPTAGTIVDTGGLYTGDWVSTIDSEEDRAAIEHAATEQDRADRAEIEAQQQEAEAEAAEQEAERVSNEDNSPSATDVIDTDTYTTSSGEAITETTYGDGSAHIEGDNGTDAWVTANGDVFDFSSSNNDNNDSSGGSETESSSPVGGGTSGDGATGGAETSMGSTDDLDGNDIGGN